jgi:hypothetical protein
VNGAGNIIGVNGKVTLMTVYKNRLYLAGECTGSSTIHGFSNAPTANLYLVSHLPPPPAGNFFQLSDRTTWARYVVAWDGTAWFPLPGTGVGYFVNAFAIFNDKLWVKNWSVELLLLLLLIIQLIQLILLVMTSRCAPVL